MRAGRAAAMFWRNAATWGGEIGDTADLVAPLRARERSDPDEVVMWEIRQTVFTRRG